MQLALSVLRDVENMKIIHLVRDPRSTLQSQTHRGVCPWKSGGIIGCAKRHCASVWDNTLVQNGSPYKDRILTIKYEDIALYPVETAKRMYDFVGLNFDENVKKYVYEVTLGGDRSGCTVCRLQWQIGPKKDSSVDHIDSWRKAQNVKWISNIQEPCKTVMKYYNYTLV